jgi:CHC2 zinc finger
MSNPYNEKRPADQAGRGFKANQFQARSYQKTAGQSKFNRSLLPKPADYFSRYLPSLKKPNAEGWAFALCPFHADSTPSLRVNLLSGGFKCMACGEHGSDVLAFHMAAHSLDFVSAAKALGAWDLAR